MAEDKERNSRSSPVFSRIRLPSRPGDKTEARAEAETDGQPRLELGEEIARGGVGAILRGRDTDLNREVAVKVLRSGFRDREDILQRFVEEAQIGGQLQHPGIVPVYDIGLLDESPYFTMKLIKGRTLAELLEERASPSSDLPRLLTVFDRVCETMAYAHARGVIHRDLKPENVMVGAFGEVLVVDWGMGKVLDAQNPRAEPEAPVGHTVISTDRSATPDGASIAGSVFGTPGYMPPEQARGDVDAMDERSDVFALGAILVTILTGRPVYDGGSTHEALVAAARCETAPAIKRLRASDAHTDLITLAIDCLAPAPVGRPENAAAVQKRLQEHLTSVEERATEARVAAATARRARKWMVAVAAALLIGFAIALFAWNEAADQRAAAEAARGTVERRNRALEVVAYAAALSRAAAAIDLGDKEDARRLLADTAPELRGFEHDWLAIQAARPTPRVIDVGEGPIERVEPSPDGRTLAVATRAGDVLLLERQTGRRLWRVAEAGHRVAWIEDGSALITLHFDGRLRRLDAGTGDALHEARIEDAAIALAVRGSSVAAASLAGGIEIRNAETLEPTRSLPCDSPARALALSPDGSAVLAATRVGGVILDSETGEPRQVFSMAPQGDARSNGPTACALSVDWSPDGRRALVCFDGGRSGIWDTSAGMLVRELKPHVARTGSIWGAFSGRFGPNDRVVTAGFEGTVRVLDAESGVLRGYFHPSAEPRLLDAFVAGVRWLDAGSSLLTWGSSSRLFMWRVADFGVARDVGIRDAVSKVVPSIDGDSLFYVNDAGELRSVRRATGAVEFSTPVGDVVYGSLVSGGVVPLPDGRQVAVIRADLTLVLVEAETGTVVRSIEPPAELAAGCIERRLYVIDATIAPDGRRIACAIGTWSSGRDQQFDAPVLVYDLATPSTVRKVAHHRGSSFGVRFLPDGRRVVTLGSHPNFCLWDAVEPVRKIRSYQRARPVTTGGYGIDVSPDGRLVAFGPRSGEVFVCDIETGEDITAARPITLHDAADRVRFVPPGNRLFAIGRKGAVSLVDLEGPPIMRTSLAFPEWRTVHLWADRSMLSATNFEGGVQLQRLALDRQHGAREAESDELDRNAYQVLLPRIQAGDSGKELVRAVEQQSELSGELRRRALELAPLIGDYSRGLNDRAAELLDDDSSLDEARALLQRALLAAELGSRDSAYALRGLGAVARKEGRLERAEREYRRAESILVSLGEGLKTATILARRALVAALRNHREEARALLARARERVRVEHGDSVPPSVAEVIAEAEQTLR